MNPVEEVALLRQRVLYSNSMLQLPSNSSSGGVQVCHCKACLLVLFALYCSCQACVYVVMFTAAGGVSCAYRNHPYG